jgi:hypothetical protein
VVTEQIKELRRHQVDQVVVERRLLLAALEERVLQAKETLVALGILQIILMAEVAEAALVL